MERVAGVWEEAGSLLERLPVGVVRTDPQGDCLALNSMAAELLGLTVEEGQGSGWLEGVDDETRRELLEQWGGDGSNPLFFTIDIPVSGKEPLRRFLMSQRVPLRGAGEPSGDSLGIILDVSRWQQTEEEFLKTTRELETRLRELDCLFEISRAVERHAGELESVLQESVGILARTWSVPHPAGARITMNGESYETPNYAPCQGVRQVSLFIHDEEVGKVEVGVLTEGGDGELGQSSSGEQGLLEAVAQRLGRTAERVLARKRLREKEEEMRERITHLTRVSTLGEMATSIAHEVNQPLTAVATYAQGCRNLIERGNTDLGEVAEVLERISKEALRAGNIVNRLKDMVRQHESHWREHHLNDLVRDIGQLASADARLHDVSLRFDLDDDLPSILADGVQVQQVVLNLIRNGIDAVDSAAPARPEVVVRTRRVGRSQVRISVEDNGCGLAEESHERLFDPFFTTKKGGTGMGLSISKSIASAHKGRISFTRNSSGGMTFYLTLPTLDAS